MTIPTLEKSDDEIGNEVAKILSDLIRIDTSNPPGNETKAAEYLYKLMEKEGIEGEIVESAENRGNLIVKLQGKNPGKNIMLLSHLDVVPANPNDWKVHPFSGEIKDGFVWGRGAIDCKGLVAIQVWALLELVKNGYQREHGDIIFVASADEERGSTYGVKWLVENRPEILKVDYLITEGGGFCIPINGKNKYFIEVAQKNVCWLKLKVKGRAGHGSLPGLEETSIVKASKIVEKLYKYKTPIEFHKITRTMMYEMLEKKGFIRRLLMFKPLTDRILRAYYKRDPGTAAFLNGILRDTITPTIIKGGYKENVIPEETEITIDSRLLPGKEYKDLITHLKKALGEKIFSQIEIEKVVVGIGSYFSEYEDNIFYNTIAEIMKELDPKSKLVPLLITGGTDSRFFRAHGTTAFGFQPLFPDISVSEVFKMIHGIDERISIKSLVLGAKFMYKLLTSI